MLQKAESSVACSKICIVHTLNSILTVKAVVFTINFKWIEALSMYIYTDR